MRTDMPSTFNYFSETFNFSSNYQNHNLVHSACSVSLIGQVSHNLFSLQGEVSWGGVLCEKGGGWWLEGIFHTGHNFSSWNISQFLLLARDQRFSTAFFSFRKWKQFSIPGWHSRVVKYLFTGNKSGNKSVLCVNLHCNYTQQQVWFVS